MCQPMPASPNSLTASPVSASVPSIATKNKSAADGTSHRIHPTCEPAAEVLEPIAIALNLIEWEPDRQENERQGSTPIGTSGRNRGRGLWRPERRTDTGSRAVQHHRYRPEKLSHLSAVALSGSHRRPFARRDRLADT